MSKLLLLLLVLLRYNRVVVVTVVVVAVAVVDEFFRRALTFHSVDFSGSVREVPKGPETILHESLRLVAKVHTESLHSTYVHNVNKIY